MQRTKEVFSVVAMACAASVYYVSAIFLSKIIAYKSSVLSLIYMIAAGALYFLAMMSKDRKTVLIKWLISSLKSCDSISVKLVIMMLRHLTR